MKNAAAPPVKYHWKNLMHARMFPQMKLVYSLSLFLLLAHLAPAKETAYQALRALGTDRGEDVLHRVIEVTGRDGVPQPDKWKIVIDDPNARGGVREVEVKNGRVVSEKTPVRGYTGATGSAIMDFQKLNLDSEGAFTVANREAAKANIGFDRVDYTLRIGDETTTPVWVLQLIDADGQHVGLLQIAADSGEVLRRDGMISGSRGRLTDEDLDIPRERVVRRDSEYEDEREYDSDYEREDDGPGVRYRIKRAFREAGASLEHFFTGRRTLDRKYRDE